MRVLEKWREIRQRPLDGQALKQSIGLFAVCNGLGLGAAIAGFPPATVTLLAVTPAIIGVMLIVGTLGARIERDRHRES